MKIERKSFYRVKEVKQTNGVGEVSFYFLRFDFPDSDGDTYDPDISIEYDQSRLRWFLNHNGDKVLGVVREIGKDEFGAYAVCEIPIIGSLAEIYELYKIGAITEHSFGFEVLDYGPNDFGGRHIKSLRLWEVSTVTSWAAQREASVISVKSNKFANNMEQLEEKIVKAIAGVKLETKLSEEESQAIQQALEGISNLQSSLVQTQQAMIDGLQQVSNTLASLMAQPALEEEILDTEAKSEITILAREKKNFALNHVIKAPSLGKLVKKTVSYTRPGVNLSNIPGMGIDWYGWVQGGLPVSYGSSLFQIANILSISNTSFMYEDITGPFSINSQSGTGWCYTPAELNIQLQGTTGTLNRYSKIMTVCNNVFDEYNLLNDRIKRLLLNLINADIEQDYAVLLLASPIFNAASYTVNISTPNVWDLANLVAESIRIESDNNYNPNVVIVHPITAFEMKNLKDANGQYLFANRPDFGLQVVSTTKLPPNQMIVGDASTLYWIELDGRSTELSISYENRDNFERDLATLRLTLVGLPFRRGVDIGAWRIVNDINLALANI